MGRVRDASFAARLLGCRVEHVSLDRSDGRNTLVLHDLMRGHSVMGLMGAPSATGPLAEMAVASDGADVVDLGDPLRDDEELLRAGDELDGVIVVGELKRTRLSALRKWMADADFHSVEPVGIVLVESAS
jgi:hypothetical protein